MHTMPETRTYQGASLEELLPRIREELGAGAVITRRREGVTGGFAGFFGKRGVPAGGGLAARCGDLGHVFPCRL